jgi:hypothetical protein
LLQVRILWRQQMITKEDLEKFPREKLLGIVLDAAYRDPQLHERLVLALAGQHGAANLVQGIRKSIKAFADSNEFFSYKSVALLERQLEDLYSAIVDDLAPSDPKAAIGVLWELLSVCTCAFERTDDEAVGISETFEKSLEKLAELCAADRDTDRCRLAEKILESRLEDDYGVFQKAISVFAPVLQEEGLAHMESRLRERLAEKSRTPRDKDTTDWEGRTCEQVLSEIAAYRRT